MGKPWRGGGGWRGAVWRCAGCRPAGRGAAFCRGGCSRRRGTGWRLDCSVPRCEGGRRRGACCAAVSRRRAATSATTSTSSGSGTWKRCWTRRAAPRRASRQRCGMASARRGATTPASSTRWCARTRLMSSRTSLVVWDTSRPFCGLGFFLFGACLALSGGRREAGRAARCMLLGCRFCILGCLAASLRVLRLLGVTSGPAGSGAAH
mmetsp:Transcript_21167/g.63182  ORF Transcript_21167/g.63182 Transcript_21167/m.63182 type:complete len:207 (+) Transcript_21167:223-843(+)